ncbi:SMP-30/gluconolactonase/LRE family protein [Deinococcus roseus]|uniref:SMP-30/Gluconolactonase/LRE-like region domain-containing protein n=1 Tax=Deinococcus roseus TaxID=392414 RepID=A0ABQ2DAW2_9DEIO|nr:SMP-30/gluconolactonase/LRE family protein [Deinococcus roseus]GGJ49580.1 hypothetical protein GCM10008938_39420 [Deinococcus roseus]
MKSLLALSALLTLGLAQARTIQVPGLQTPESVLYDAKTDLYLVSNINGDPFAKDNNGFIAQVSPDGQILNARWIAGGSNGVTLHSPKGLAVVGNILYVADIDTVRLFNRKTGQFLRNIVLGGSTFLNDIATDAQGNVYVSDSGFLPEFKPSGTDAIFKIGKDRKATVLAKGEQLAHPNGLLVQKDGTVVVAPFGSGEVYALNADKHSKLGQLPDGGLDGLLWVGNRFLVSSWNTQTIYALGADGKNTVLLNNVPSPADIGYDSKRNRLLIPVFTENRIILQDL